MLLMKMRKIFPGKNRYSHRDVNFPGMTIREYMTKMTLRFQSIASIPFSLLSAAAWIFDIIPADTFFILLAMSILFSGGVILLQHGYWNSASIIPPLVTFCTAFYGTYIGGINAPAILLYVLTIILSASLRGIGAMYFFSFLSLTSFLITNLAHYYGYINQIRSGDTVFWNRIISSSAAFTGIIILLRFIIVQFYKALEKSRDEIAERRIIEKALRESEKNYRELVQNSNSIILRINSRGKITFCNDFGKNIFGFSNDEIIGKNVIGTILPEYDSSGNNLKQMMNKILANPETFHFNENENITKDGKRIWIAWANAPVIDNDGNFREVLCIGNDITEKKLAMEEKEKIQNQLLHAQKMEAIGTLTSGLAHDFNNILAGITGSLSLLKINLSKENINSREEAEGYIDLAMQSSRKASDMIKQLLLLSRRQEIAFKPVDINAAMKNVVSICSNSFPKDIQINIKFASKPVIVMTDEVLIEQMFLNFFVNSLHAITIMNPGKSEEGGKISVVISSAISNDNNSEAVKLVRIDVSDNGIGMSENTIQRIFDPFFTTKPKESGTGLGLSMAYGFIKRMGGFIKIESALNRGTTFSIYIPELTEEDTALSINEKPGELKYGDATILIIDDEDSVLTIAEKTLSICGYKVLKADNGIKGISLINDYPGTIDMVILDISMPFMSGFEVFEKIHSSDSEIKVILSSGLADDDRITQALAAGAAGFLPKPYTAEDLSQKVFDIINYSDKKN